MKAEESYDIKTDDGQMEGSGVPGQPPPSSGVNRVIFGLALLLTVAGAVVYRGISTCVRAAADVKADTRDLAVPAVSLAQPKRSAPQEEIVLPGNIQAFIDAPIYARTSGYLKRWYVDIGGTLLTEVDVANPTGEILPGAYAEVRLKLPSATSTVVIPVTSLIFRSEGLRVGVVRNGHATLIPITIGRDFGTEVEVVAGLNGSEKVITNPPDSLVEGQEVRIAASGTASWGAE